MGEAPVVPYYGLSEDSLISEIGAFTADLVKGSVIERLIEESELRELIEFLIKLGINKLSPFSRSAIITALLDIGSKVNGLNVGDLLGISFSEKNFPFGRDSDSKGDFSSGRDLTSGKDFRFVTSLTVAERDVEGIMKGIERFCSEDSGKGREHPAILSDPKFIGDSPSKKSVIKIKLGFEDDIKILTDALIRLKARFPVDRLFNFSVDVNQGWDRCDLIEKFLGLANLVERGFNVEFVEEPVSWTGSGNAKRLEEFFKEEWFKSRVCRSKSLIPVFLDESVKSLSEVKDLVGMVENEGSGDSNFEELNIGLHVVRGIVVKLGKMGGPVVALNAIRLARNAGFGVMIGCFIESNVGISAAMHIAGECDYIDLDAPFLIKNNPVKGVEAFAIRRNVEGRAVRWGVLTLPKKPGLGVELR